MKQTNNSADGEGQLCTEEAVLRFPKRSSTALYTCAVEYESPDAITMA